MRVLLDTHSFLWFLAGDSRLSPHARQIMTDFENDLVLSVASLWEIAIKTSLGKLALAAPYDELFPQQLQQHEIHVLQIQLSHLCTLTSLPFHHRDPFDRLIIAQGATEDLPIMSVDSVFSSYPVHVIW